MCVMDYSAKLWWEGRDLVRDAILGGDPRPIERALQGYRDRVVAAGGVCYIDAANPEGLSLAQRLLAAATVATIGELFLEIGESADWDDAYRASVSQLLQARRRYPALAAGGARIVLSTSDDARSYAFIREPEGAGDAVLVVLNFQSEAATIAVDLGGRTVILCDVMTGERLIPSGSARISLPGYGYALFALEQP
jgi:hypothetical protein